MGTPPVEELLKKIEELEVGQAHLKHEMSRLKLSGAADGRVEQDHRQRSHSMSPQRSRMVGPRRRAGGGRLGGLAAWKKGSSSFNQASPLQRESRGGNPQSNGVGGCGPSAVNFTDRQYLNILHSMGQSVHILDLNCHIIYW